MANLWYLLAMETTCFGLWRPSSGFDNFLAIRVIYNVHIPRGDVEISTSPLGLCILYTGCVSESGDFKNVMKSKRFHLFSFNTHEHNVYIKEFRFFHFQFNPFNNLTH